MTTGLDTAALPIVKHNHGAAAGNLRPPECGGDVPPQKDRRHATIAPSNAIPSVERNKKPECLKPTDEPQVHERRQIVTPTDGHTDRRPERGHTEAFAVRDDATADPNEPLRIGPRRSVHPTVFEADLLQGRGGEKVASVSHGEVIPEEPLSRGRRPSPDSNRDATAATERTECSIVGADGVSVKDGGRRESDDE